MEIEILEMADRKGKLIIKNSSPAMANALRRTMMSDIPKMAIDEVEFHLGSIMSDDKEYESRTPLFDEIIAHRLGMVPIPTDYNLFTFRDKCSCGGDGCPSCTITYCLNKTGPCTIYSGDMMVYGNPNLKPTDENIPIVELIDGQAVMIFAHAVMGTARKHVKWQAAFGVGYKYLPIIEIDPSKADDADVQAVVKECPKHVLGVKDGKLVVVNRNACCLCDSCERFTNGAVKVHGDDTNFIFTYETDGSLTARQVLDKALEILVAETEELAAQARSL